MISLVPLSKEHYSEYVASITTIRSHSDSDVLDFLGAATMCGNTYSYAILADNAFVGSLRIYDDLSGDLNLDYFIGLEHQNKRYATQAVGKIEELVDSWNANRLVATTVSGNTHSQKVLENNGFQREELFAGLSFRYYKELS